MLTISRIDDSFRLECTKAAAYTCAPISPKPTTPIRAAIWRFTGIEPAKPTTLQLSIELVLCFCAVSHEFFAFHLMPNLLVVPPDESAWTWLPNSIYEPEHGRELYNRYLDEFVPGR